MPDFISWIVPAVLSLFMLLVGAVAKLIMGKIDGFQKEAMNHLSEVKNAIDKMTDRLDRHIEDHLRKAEKTY